MAYKNRYFKNLVGINNNYSFIGIAGQVEYSAQATFAAFVASSVAGELGVYNKATGALISGAGAVSTTLPIFIAINAGLDKEGKSIIRTTEEFTVANSKFTKTSYLAPVKGTTSLVCTAGVVAAGDVLGLKILDLTIGGNPVNSFNFEITVKAGESLDTAMARLAAVVNDTAGVALKSRDQLVSATYTAGTDTLLISNVDFGSVVKVLPLGKLASIVVTTTVVKTVLGHGFPDMVKLFEETSFIRDGVTTNYPSTPMTNAESFGKPPSLIVSTGQYLHYTIKNLKSDDAKIAAKIQYWPDTLEVIVPSNGAVNAAAELALIFGV
jgi:hypothetical protein